MSVEVPEGALRQLRSDLGQLARGTLILRGIDRAVKVLLKEEFATGEGPYGKWQPTVRGRQALESRKLATAFKSTIGPNGLRYSAKSKRDFLQAHQTGHEFPERQRAANQQFLTFNAKGRLTKNGRILNKKGEVKRGYYQIFARAHTVGMRVLPARPIIPEGAELPPKWEQTVERGATAAVEKWHERAER